MYTDWGDAPERVKYRRRDTHARVTIWLVVVLLFAAAIAYLMLKPSAPAAWLAPPPVTSQHAPAPAAGQSTSPAPGNTQQNQGSQASIEWSDDDYDRQVAARLKESESQVDSAAQPGKQTVFNDQNYVASQQVNTIKSVKPVAAAKPEAQDKIHFGGIKHASETCWYPKGSIECRRFKAQLKKAKNRVCHSSENWNSPACRRAAAFNPVE